MMTKFMTTSTMVTTTMMTVRTTTTRTMMTMKTTMMTSTTTMTSTVTTSTMTTTTTMKAKMTIIMLKTTTKGLPERLEKGNTDDIVDNSVKRSSSNCGNVAYLICGFCSVSYSLRVVS